MSRPDQYKLLPIDSVSKTWEELQIVIRYKFGASDDRRAYIVLEFGTFYW